jgi:hypothetical protein
MNCTDWKEKMHDYVDAELSPAETRALEAHLAQCPECRAALGSLRALLDQTAALKKEIPPPRDLWPEIAHQLEVERLDPQTPARTADELIASESRRSSFRWLPVFAAAAALAIGIGVAIRWNHGRALTGNTWSVASVAGTPRVGAKNFQGEIRLGVGQWLETDAASRAKLAVGSIGEVSIEPNSRLRLVDTSTAEHRVELARGKMHALIWAPPRLFFVNTPSATAIDLGCAYTLAVDDDGGGLLHVTSGYVALEHDGRESIIPAGLMCATRTGAGPGTPFAADAPAGLRAALDRFDFEKDGTALPAILAQSRAEDGVTLWHLLNRATSTQRGEIFDVLSKHHAPPATVTRAGIVAGDAAMRNRWASDFGLGGFTSR